MEIIVLLPACPDVNLVTMEIPVTVVKTDIFTALTLLPVNAQMSIAFHILEINASSALQQNGIHIPADVALVVVTARITHVSVMEPVSVADHKNMVTSVREHVVIGVETKCVIEMVTVSLV